MNKPNRPTSTRRTPKKKGHKSVTSQPTAAPAQAKPTIYETLHELQHRQPKSMEFRGEDRHPRLVRLYAEAGRRWRVHFGTSGVEAAQLREQLGVSPSADTHTELADGVVMISVLTATTLEKLGLIHPRDDGSYETSQPAEILAKDAIHPLGCVVECRGIGENRQTYFLQVTDGDHLARVWARSLLSRQAELTEMAVSLLLTQANEGLNCIKDIRDSIDSI